MVLYEDIRAPNHSLSRWLKPFISDLRQQMLARASACLRKSYITNGLWSHHRPEKVIMLRI